MADDGTRLRDRMRSVARLLTRAISCLDEDGMPTQDLWWELHQAGEIDVKDHSLSLPERILRLAEAFMAWADGHYLAIEQDERDAWLEDGIARTRQLHEMNPDVDEELCTLAATLLEHIRDERPWSILESIASDLPLATLVEGRTETHAAIALGLQTLMQSVDPDDQRIAIAKSLNLIRRIVQENGK